LGEPVKIDLEIYSPQTDTRDIVINTRIKNENTGHVVDGFELRTLNKLKGKASYSAIWDNTDFESGNYIISVELRDLKGDLLDEKVINIRLGIGSGKVLSLEANPEQYQSGDRVKANMIFKNSGNTPISGTAIIQINNSTGSLKKYEHKFSDLRPSNTIEFTYEWETKNMNQTLEIVGYVMYEGLTTLPVIDYISYAPTTPSLEPSPSSETGNPKGIPGFPVNSIFIGGIIAAIIIKMMQIKQIYSCP
jgi:hypothetical protein